MTALEVEDEIDVAHGPCGSCGHDPACGHASITTLGGTTWFCHEHGHSCYETVTAAIGCQSGEAEVFIGLEPGIPRPVFNSTGKVWYCKVEGGEVVEARSVDDSSEVDIPPTHPSLRCSCEACLSSRAAIRENAIHGAPLPKTGKSGVWADRKWDGPLADFPGISSNDSINPAHGNRRRSSKDK